jgi:hypothetical protein
MPASAVLYDTIIEKRITLPPSPELAQHAAGAVAKHSRRGWRVDKPANSRVQIDGLIALAMALDRHVTQRRPPSGSGSSRCRRPCIGCGRLIPGGSRCPRCRVARPRAPTASHPQHLRDRPLVRALRRTGRAPRPRRAAQPRRQGRHVELAGTLREVQPRQGRPLAATTPCIRSGTTTRRRCIAPACRSRRPKQIFGHSGDSKVLLDVYTHSHLSDRDQAARMLETFHATAGGAL